MPSKWRPPSGSARVIRISPVVLSTMVSPTWARNSGVRTLPSAWSMRDRCVGSTSRTVGVEQAEGSGRLDCGALVDAPEFDEDVRAGQPGGAPVEVVVAANGPVGEPQIRAIRKALTEQVAKVAPDDWGARARPRHAGPIRRRTGASRRAPTYMSDIGPSVGTIPITAPN